MIADPAEFLDLARLVDARADAVASIRDQLGRSLDAAKWTGPGADGFRADAAQLARILGTDADALRSAAVDLRALADQLTHVLDALRSIETDVRAWLAANPPGLSPTPSPWPATDLPPSGDPRWQQVQQAFLAAGIHVGGHGGAAPPPTVPVGPPDAARTESVLGLPVTPAEKWIIDHEDATYSTTAYNPVDTTTGHAYGLGQLTEVIRRKYLGADYNTTDPVKQLDAMRAYIHDRYGTAEKAVEFWKVKNWY